MTVGKNWGGNLTYSASQLVEPTSVAELAALLPTLPDPRPLGSRHSFSRVADTAGALVSTGHLPREIEVDSARALVRVSSATRYGELAPLLDDAGWALANLASLPHLSVAGAVATGTHGSGDRLGSLATQVAALELVTFGGELRRVERGEPDFAGMVVSLGRLAVVTALELDLVPTFEVVQTVYEHVSLDRVLAHLDSVTELGYSVSIFTTWTVPDQVDQVWVKRRVGDVHAADPIDLLAVRPAAGQRHPIPGLDPEPTTEQGRPGPWWDRLPHFRMAFTPSAGQEIQSEWLVPRQHATAAILAVRSLAARIAPLLQVSELRSVAADDLWLSPAYGTDVFALHFTWHLDVAGVDALLPQLEARLRPYQARPHPGKVHREAEVDTSLYPRWADWMELRQRWTAATA
ncbi:MAG: FAD-binding protein [Ornithinimicrobium sp.]|uniref:FAD-binding protein n=1 Tax=Ornithinimicrobium sp. TaxID=1977084 RepID=UPI0026E004DB|nr:FAD-binding protein [Ornithinimicrobium sp.]MDO5740223.1 FAD-binding protein [Ornithinimicrobium sp.]